jgi:hypothetical protein
MAPRSLVSALRPSSPNGSPGWVCSATAMAVASPTVKVNGGRLVAASMT